MNDMKLLGLIGGLSFASSLDYYRLINEQIGQRLGQLHSSRLILYSLDLEPYSQFAYQSDFEGISSFVADAAEVLYQAGAEILVICSNTAHMAFPAIQKRIPSLPILHIADVVAQAIKNEKITTVGFLGTLFSMKERFLLDRLERHGISVIIPDKEDELAAIQRIIEDELSHNKVVPASRGVFLRNVDEIRQRGAQGIILGCTEIQMILSQKHVSGLPLFDSMTLHVKAAVDVQLGKKIEDFLPGKY
ncbi:aspartate/glutamate racemase family protein [Acidobacteriota bacterium]